MTKNKNGFAPIEKEKHIFSILPPYKSKPIFMSAKQVTFDPVLIPMPTKKLEGRVSESDGVITGRVQTSRGSKMGDIAGKVGDIAGGIGETLVDIIGGVINFIGSPGFIETMSNINDVMREESYRIGPSTATIPEYLIPNPIASYEYRQPRIPYTQPKNNTVRYNNIGYSIPKSNYERSDYINKPNTTGYVNFNNQPRSNQEITMEVKKTPYKEIDYKKREELQNPYANEESQIRNKAKKYPLLKETSGQGNNTYEEKRRPMMGDWDYVVPNVRVLETKNDRIKNAILKKEIEEAIKNKRRADAIYGSDEEYYQKYHPGREIPRDETEELKSRYIEVNNVLYPRDIAEIDELVKSAQAELEAIERERWMGHTKNAIGAAISIGSAFIPATTGARITEILAKALAPKLGTKLAFEVARNSVIGAMSGATMGLGDSLIYNENPLETMLRYAIINSAIGAGTGALGYQIARSNLQNAILKNPANKELLEKYYQEYVEGFENKANELSEYRRIKKGIEERGKTSTLQDKIKPIWLDEQEYAIVMHEINTNITQEELSKLVLRKNIGNYKYTFIVHEYGEYTIIKKELIK